MDMKPETRVPLAYARIRGNLRDDFWTMPHWDDLEESQRLLLIKIWSIGVEDAMANLAERMKNEPL